MDALRVAKYQHATSIRLWRTNCEDEGVRAVCNYIAINPFNVVCLELMANDVTSLGCEFIGKLIHPDMKTNLKVLKLDHNNFGSEGLNKIAIGLSSNKNI